MRNFATLYFVLLAGSAGLVLHSRVAPILDEQQHWQEHIAKRVQQVASMYPVDYRSNVSNYSLFQVFQDTGKLPQPITDHGTIPQAKWPFALSHNRLQTGGWARQQNVDVLPVATKLAGVNMHLDKGAYRKMHWHSAAEWAYVLEGTTWVAAVDPDGKNYVADVEAGNLWYFPAGTPHLLQGVSDNGTEFLLVFDGGSFSEDSTLLLTNWMAHIPREVIAKNFGQAGLSTSAFDKFPSQELYIFPGEVDSSTNGTSAVDLPQGHCTEQPFTYNLNNQALTQFNGGSIKVVDSSKFAVSKNIAAALVTIQPGAIQELHWHPNSPEWDYFIKGHARITSFAGQNNACTYDFQAGDTAYISEQNGHHIENIGDTDVQYLEIFKTDTYKTSL
ncbi:related to Oxalate decarboxylase OxdC [Ustilago trichophora]|uniref:Related to Oxalate decarboxylase OxdC n=1 Tax=Ustilago trichophora TaxID=86804 RepID=A0A5C3E5E1_9BASI|nr:related to Oxalate decarboxylase OxdC [Ustilago trichophora]